MNRQIAIYKMGLESSMAHCISQNLIADAGFDVEWYLNECRSLFLSIGVDPIVVEEMISKGRDTGWMEYTTGMTVPGVDAGAQLHPSSNPHFYASAEKLVQLMEVK